MQGCYKEVSGISRWFQECFKEVQGCFKEVWCDVAYCQQLTPCSLLLAPYSLLLTPCSLLLAPYPLLLTPCSLLLAPYSLPLTTSIEELRNGTRSSQDCVPCPLTAPHAPHAFLAPCSLLLTPCTLLLEP